MFRGWVYITSSSFPSKYIGTWKRDKFNNTLTFTTDTIKTSNQSYAWNLTDVSPGPNGSKEYTISPTTDITYWITDTVQNNKITIQTVGSSLIINGDRGRGEDNWNGTWKKQ